MKKLSILLVVILALGDIFMSCSNGKTYAEMKKEEKESIQRFIELNDINVIDYETFEDNNFSTDTAKNEFVLLSEKGVYMQIVDKGNGKKLEDGRYEILARFVEQEINKEGKGDSSIWNNTYPEPDVFMLKVRGTQYEATFTEGTMANYYGTAFVPSGWLLPFEFITPGRVIRDRSRLRLIVPHSVGNSYATSNVLPFYYEITYQLGL